MIERNVDYLSASLCLSESAVVLKGFKPINPVKFYKRGYLHPNGFRIYFGNPNSSKAMAVASGETMDALRGTGKLDAEIIGWVLSEGGMVSRLDLAVTEWNTFEGMIELSDIERWFVKNLIESPLAAFGCKEISEVHHNGKEAQTIYIGDMEKRGKKGIFRAYDKGVQMDIGRYMATRIELEVKRDKAHHAATRIAESNDIAGNFRAYFNVRSNDFNRLMDADAVRISRGKAQEKTSESEETLKRWAWLLNQVAPALKTAIEDERKAGRDDKRLIEFMARSGILSDARKIALELSDMKYRDKLRLNELQPIEKD